MLIINKIAEVPKVKNEVGSSKATHTLSLRGEREASDVAIHRVSGDVVDLSLRLQVHSGSPRAFSPRDDKMWRYEIGDSVHQAHCHCEEERK